MTNSSLRTPATSASSDTTPNSHAIFRSDFTKSGRLTSNAKYRRIFGQIDTLDDQTSWTTGLASLLEFLTWSTGNLLGITKTQLVKLVVRISNDDQASGTNIDQKLAYVQKELQRIINASNCDERYAQPSTTLASPREAARRTRFFSEEYLNKEFDIFMSLASDRYLDRFYSQFTALRGGGQWRSHSNCGLFSCSTEIDAMQMDNLAYNQSEKLLVANELKLGGKKNPDQLLKYGLMVKLLLERGFIVPGTRVLLLFISDRTQPGSDWQAEIDSEIEHARRSTKSTALMALSPECISLARSMEHASTTWADMVAFNRSYMERLDPVAEQVEWKLLSGFNETLGTKNFIRI